MTAAHVPGLPQPGWGFTYRATCTCGWRTRRCWQPETAAQLMGAHVRKAT